MEKVATTATTLDVAPAVFLMMGTIVKAKSEVLQLALRFQLFAETVFYRLERSAIMATNEDALLAILRKGTLVQANSEILQLALRYSLFVETRCLRKARNATREIDLAVVNVKSKKDTLVLGIFGKLRFVSSLRSVATESRRKENNVTMETGQGASAVLLVLAMTV